MSRNFFKCEKKISFKLNRKYSDRIIYDSIKTLNKSSNVILTMCYVILKNNITVNDKIGLHRWIEYTFFSNDSR